MTHLDAVLYYCDKNEIEVESVSKVEVVDGVFEVESVEEILNSMDEESRDEMSELSLIHI